MERPQEIIRFVTMGCVAAVVNAGATLVLMAFNFRAAAPSLVGVAIVAGLIGWVLLGRSPIARVATTIWLAFITGAAIASYAVLIVQHHLSAMNPTIHLLSLISIASNIFALYFLWTAPATAWLQKQTDIS